MRGNFLTNITSFHTINDISMDQPTREELKQALTAEQDRLTAELKAIAVPDPRIAGNWTAEYPKFEAEESGSHANRDQEEDEVEEYESRLEAEHSLESRLLHVTQALGRIDTAEYGICTKCKKDIPLERLRANPAAEYHTEHEQ